MGKKGLIMAGVTGVIFLVVVLIGLTIFSSVFSSAMVMKEEYLLGERVKIGLKGIENCRIKVVSPSNTYVAKASDEIFVFRPEENGSYTLEIDCLGLEEKYNFNVVDDEEIFRDGGSLSDNEATNFEQDVQINSSDNADGLTEVDPSNNVDLLYDEGSKIVVGSPVKWKEKILISTSQKSARLRIPRESFNASVYKISDGRKEKLNSSVEEDSLFNYAARIFIGEASRRSYIVLENAQGDFELEYYTPAPVKEERNISGIKKEVVVSSSDDLHYENVTAFTDLPRQVSDKGEVRIYWKEEDVYLDFDAYDKDSDGLFDYVEWIVPHLSDQTFEIIVITGAEHLDENRTFIEDVYDLVKERDEVFVLIPDRDYLRVMFEENLTSENDITIYAKSSDGARVEVYEKDSGELIADFGVISDDKKYQIFLNNLSGEQDTFDLKVVDGDVEFDYVVDPVVNEFLETFPNTDSSWTGDDDGDTAQDEWWNVTQETGGETSLSVSTDLSRQGGSFGTPPSPSSFLRWIECDPNNFNGCFVEARDTWGNYWNPQGNNWTSGNISFYWAYYVDVSEGIRLELWNGSSSSWVVLLENLSTSTNNFVDWTPEQIDLPLWVFSQTEFAFRFSADSPGPQDIVLLDNVTIFINLTSSDTTPPVVTIYSPLNQTYATSIIDLNVSTDEEASTCLYSLDGNANISMNSINSTFFSSTVAGLREDAHLVVFSCSDILGNTNSTSISFSIDIGSPNFRVIRGSDSLSSVSFVNVSINVSDYSKAFVIFGKRTSQSTPNNRQITAGMPSNKSIVFERVGSSGVVDVEWEVVESNKFYVQRDEYSYGTSDSSVTIDINSVNVSRSFIIVTNRLNSGTSGDNAEGLWKASLVDSDTIKFDRGETGSSGVLSWQVIEWSGANVQSGEITSSDSGVTVTDSLLSEVDLDTSFLVFSYNISGPTATALSETNVLGYFINSTDLNFNRVGADGAFSVSWFVIEDTQLDVQRSTISVSGSSPINETIFEVNISNAFSIKSHDSTGGGTTFANSELSHRIANSTILEFLKGTASQTQNASWFVIEFFSNRAPTQSTPILNTTSGLNTTSENLTVHSQGTFDPDGDAIKNIISWYLDSSPLTILNFPFEGGSTSSFTKDYSSLSNNGTVVGAVYSSNAGYDGKGAYEFDGINDRITINEIDSGTIVLWIRNATGWYHLANSSGITYVNGQPQAVSIPFNDTAIGVYSDGSFFNGTIDDVLIFNRTLTQQQISAIYNNRTDLIVSDETLVGDVWRACVTPNDGSLDGSELCSNSISIVGQQIDINVTTDQNSYTQGDVALVSLNATAFGSALDSANTTSYVIEGITSDLWWNSTWHYRIPVIFNASEHNRTDMAVVYSVNFTDVLSNELGLSSLELDNNSIRVLEYSSNSHLLLPAQFNPADNFDSLTNAVGEVVWILNGTIPQNTVKNYYIYFDTNESVKNPPNFTNQITETDIGTVREINLSVNNEVSIRINVEETSDGTQADRESFISLFEIGGFDFTSPVGGMDGIAFIDTTNGGSQFNVNLVYNSTPISGSVHVRVILDVVPDAGGATVGQVYLDFYPTRYFEMTTIGKSFGITNIAWIAPNSANRGAYEDSSTGITVITADATFTSEGQWVANDVNENLTVIAWNLTNSGQQTNVSQINFDAGGTDVPSWDGDADDTELDVYFAILNTTDFNESSKFAESMLDKPVVGSPGQRLALTNLSFTNSDGIANFSFDTTNENPNNYSVVVEVEKINFETGFNSTIFEIQAPAATQAPVVILTGPASNFIQNSSTIFLFYNTTDVNGNLANSTLILNGQRNQTNQSALLDGQINNFTITLNDGVYNWTVNVTDTTNLEGTNTSERLFTIDTQDPLVTPYAPLAGESIGFSSVLFNFSVSDNLDSILTCDLVVDSNILENDFNADNGTFVNFTETIGAGLHWWNVTCVDDASNTGFSETRNFTITDESPAVLLVTANNSFTTTGNIILEYNATDNNGFSGAILILNGQENQTNQSEVLNGQVNNFTLTSLAEGVYTWNVNVTDDGGFSVVNESTRTFTVDLTDPNVTLNLPGNNTISNSSTVDFNFTVTDTIDTSLTCDLYVGEASDLLISSANGTLVNRQLTSLTDGNKLWNVTCTDDSGRLGLSENRLVNIMEKPSIQLQTDNNTFFNVSSFNLSYVPLDNTNLSACELYIDGSFNQSNQSAVVNGQQSNFSVVGIAEGLHTWYVSCNDTISLQNQSETRTFTVDLDGLSVELLAPENGTELFSDTVEFSYNATDNLDLLIQCDITVNSIVEDSFNATSGAITNRSVFFSQGGFKLWNVTCTDDSSNTVVSETRNFTLAFAPVVTLSSPPINTYQNVSEITLFYEVSDDNDNIANSTLILNGEKNVTNQSAIVNQEVNNFTITLNDGVYNWTVNVTDTTNLESTDLNEWNFTIDTGAPNVTLIEPENNSIVTWNNFTFNFSVEDNLDSLLECNLYLNGGLEASLNVTSGTDGTHNLIQPDGDYLWNVTCLDDSGNFGTSYTFNFTMEAPPNVTLGDPANNSFENTTTTEFYYTPSDPIDIANCTLVIDGIENQTEILVTNMQENLFTVLGIGQGEHNWTVGCTDSDNNLFQPDEKFFTTDSLYPEITLNWPLNNTNTLRTVNFNFTATDDLDSLLECNLTIDGSVNISSILADNGSESLQTVGGLSLGSHTWSVDCVDNATNLNSSATYDFNVTLADLMVNTTSITFNDSNPKENETITINATIYNLENVTVPNITVQFYDGDPDSGGVQVGQNQTIGTMSPLSFEIVSINWPADIGTSDIFVVVDPPFATNGSIEEWDEANNKANKSVTVGSWHFIYGDVNSLSEFDLATPSNNSVLRWDAANFESGNLYVTDSESSIYWTSLQAIGKDVNGADTSNDFSEIDTLLNMTGFVDSVSNLFLNESGSILNISSFIIFNRIIDEVPVTNSTNNTNFVTGILWDTSDDSNDEFDSLEKEDIVFITPINKGLVGTYGTYDYEMRIPAKLREYKDVESRKVVFYSELR